MLLQLNNIFKWVQQGGQRLDIKTKAPASRRTHRQLKLYSRPGNYGAVPAIE
ncbi:hypothetical protein ZORO111903_01780 [Zobellia roscoffensis]